MRVIAVCVDGPERGLEITLVGQSATETVTVPEEWVPPPIDLGPPSPGEEVRRVSYWYVRSFREHGVARYVHLYALDDDDRDMLWGALHPAPAWELPDGSGRKAARPASAG